jgi:FG-GAP repeat
LAGSIVMSSAPASNAATFGYKDQPPPLPGWTHAQPFRDDTAQRHGIVLAGEDIVRGSPIIAEIDGNSSNGREVTIGGQDGQVYVYRANGSLAWSANALPSGCGVQGGDGRMNSAPAVGEIFGNGVPYVVVAYGTIQESDCDGGVVVFRGNDGAVAWRFSLRNWRNSQGYSPESLYGVTSSPALADVDGDGQMEIGFGGYDRNIYLLNAAGSVRWYYHAADTIWSSPAFVDVTGDGRLEMVIGSDITANAQLGTSDGGYVHAFDTAARQPSRVEFCAPAFPSTCQNNPFLWRTAFDQAIYSSPIVADVLSSNAGPEIIIGSGCFFPAASTDKRGRWIKILRPGDGVVLQTLNAPACVSSSAAVGDLDDDGKLEIVATVMGATALGGDGNSKVVAWNPENSNPWWSMAPRDPNSGFNDAYGADLQSPVVADVDGNGSLEVLVANFWSVHVLNGRTGAALTCQGPSSSCGSTKSLFTWKTVKSTPAVGDINGDGVLDVVIGSGNVLNSGSRGQLYAWTNIQLGSPGGAQAPYSAPWPMFRGNATHTGVHGVNASISVSPEMLPMLGEIGQSTTTSFVVNRSDGGSWTVAESSDQHNIIRLQTTSGKGRSTVTLLVTAPANPGDYDAEVVVKSQGFPDQIVQMTVRVVTDVSRTYMPLTRKP